MFELIMSLFKYAFFHSLFRSRMVALNYTLAPVCVNSCQEILIANSTKGTTIKLDKLFYP